jgi:hypothetical protein
MTVFHQAKAFSKSGRHSFLRIFRRKAKKLNVRESQRLEALAGLRGL